MFRAVQLLRAVPWVGLLAATAGIGAGVVANLPHDGSGTGPAVHRPVKVDGAALATVDLELVHERLFPDWVVSGGGLRRLHFERIRREAGKDPNLGELLDRMQVLFEDDPGAHATELLGLVRAWNEYLAAAGEPWRLDGEVRVGDRGGAFFLKVYRVIFDGGAVTVGEKTFPAEIWRRVDNTTLVDGWLGRMHDPTDGVVVLLDAVTDLALDEVWPILGPTSAPDGSAIEDAPISPAPMRPFAAAIRAEVEAALPPDAVAALRATAEDRYWMRRAADAIHARHACGSAFLVSRIPWNGLSARDLSTLQATAAAGAASACPDVTETEALVFAVRSGKIRRTPGLREALEQLVGFVAGTVAVHEARHAADDSRLAEDGMPCFGCPEGSARVDALEGSAYLASFASPGRGALAMYQACALDPDVVPDTAAMVGFVAGRITEGGCAAGPPPDLPERARALERAIFGRSEPISVADLPASLPIGDPGAP